MKKTQSWFQNLKQRLFQSVFSGIIFVLTVVGLGALLVYAVVPGFTYINDDQQLTYDEWVEAVEHLFWKPSSAGGIKYEGNIEVGGGVKVGTMTTTCSASNAGMLRYDNDGLCMFYCNGSNWVTMSCSTDGACGTANGTTGTLAPTSNLCAAGTASSVSGSGPRTWTCNGSNGGTTANCSANKKVNGTCGSVNGTNVTAAPTSNLCSVGTASAVSGSGPWTWTCNGSNGGTTANCSANKKVNGVCGSANGTNITAAPTSNLCSVGTASTVSGSGPWTWTCAGLNGGTNASCSANKQTLSCGVGSVEDNGSCIQLCYEGTTQSNAGIGITGKCQNGTPSSSTRRFGSMQVNISPLPWGYYATDKFLLMATDNLAVDTREYFSRTCTYNGKSKSCYYLSSGCIDVNSVNHRTCHLNTL